ncbi:MAG: hypothetical protein CMC18_07470 [Flavobacteriaceae bacterium]|nr:hypothetical protein [Flavobacteriaceae bacterium]
MVKKIFILVVFFCVSCSESLKQPPENLIPQEKMLAIYYDLAVLTALNNMTPATLKNQNIEMMQYLYDKYEIDSLTLSQSNTYYASLPDVYDKMFDSIQVKLERKVDEINDSRKNQSRTMGK